MIKWNPTPNNSKYGELTLMLAADDPDAIPNMIRGLQALGLKFNSIGMGLMGIPAIRFADHESILLPYDTAVTIYVPEFSVNYFGKVTLNWV